MDTQITEVTESSPNMQKRESRAEIEAECSSTTLMHVRDALALVSSLMSLAAQEEEDHETTSLRHVHDRVDVLAAAYEHATQNSIDGTVDVTTFVAGLIDDIGEISDEDLTVAERGHCTCHQKLALRDAVALGLLLSEMLSAAHEGTPAEHGVNRTRVMVDCPPDEACRVTVTSARIPTWTSCEHRTGVTLQGSLIDALASQLRARIEAGANEHGVPFWRVEL